jgi:hypothetical protein
MDKQSRQLNREFHSQQSRRIQLPSVLVKTLVKHLQVTKERFGIEPEPGDPVFIDPNADTPQEFDIELYEKELITVMVKAGLDPATYYAFQKTGIFVLQGQLGQTVSRGSGGMESSH